MKFQYFRCDCGYILISASEKPQCPDCGKNMHLVTDEAGKKKIDKKMRPIVRRIAFGPGGDH